MFTNGLGHQGSIIPKTQKNNTCLTLSIMRYGSRVSGAISEKKVAPSPYTSVS